MTRPAVMASLAVWAAAVVWSAIAPDKFGVWVNETIWAVAGLIAVLLLWRRFPLTTMLCVVLAVWAAVLAYGGHYTYANTPFGRTLAGWFGVDRNPWDRVGHFMQGFAPAILAREILWRRSPLRGSAWLNPVAFAWCMTLTACWELLEWLGAEVTDHGRPEFLGGQGDVWDTQWDMFMCLIGALIALALLSRWHERQLRMLVGPLPT